MSANTTRKAGRAAIVPGVLVLVGLVGVAIAQDVPNLVAGRNGEIEAIFASNNCVVYYDASGRRRNSLPACRAAQVAAADRGVSGYRREQGMAAPAADTPPFVNIGETGFGSVSFRDGCVVNYRQDGRRQNANDRCTGAQRRRADDAMADYRRGRGLGRHGPGFGAPPPELSVNDRTGIGTVRFQDGCTALYRRDGTRLTTGARCSRDQARRADDAMDRYRREQGMATSIGAPRVSQLRNGTVQMLYSDPFCSTYFNKNGIRTSSTKQCTKQQMVDSALRIIVYRREHGAR